MQMAVIHTCQRQNFSIGICIDKEFQIYTKAYKKIVNKCLLILKSLHHLTKSNFDDWMRQGFVSIFVNFR